MRSTIDRLLARPRAVPPDLERQVARGSVMAGLFGDGAQRRRLGRYELQRVLGSGAHGVVFAGRDTELDRRVAIKVVRTLGDDTTALADRLAAEARALARLSHPNVVEVYDVGTEGDTVYIVMEAIEGDSLEAWLEQARRPDAILGVFEAAGRGLAAAHRAGLIHRDFKPSNVLLGAGAIKVADFGLARAGVSTLEGDTVHATHPDAGTPAYMAPEQHRRGDIDARADQFAFCVALWEALAGRLPFVAASPDALLRAKLAGPPPERPGPASRRLARVLRRGLAPQPADRYSNMDALLEAMDHATTPRTRPLAAGVLAAAVALGATGLASAAGSQVDCADAPLAPETETPDAWVAMEIERIGSAACDDAAPASDPPAAATEELAQLLQQAREAASQKRPADALLEIDRLLDHAHRGGHRAAVVELLIWRGELGLGLDESDLAVAALRDAYFIALDEGFDDKALRAALELAFTHGVRVRGHEEAARWLDSAQALLDRLGRPPELQARLLGTRGSIQVETGSPTEAVHSLRRAVALCEPGASCPAAFASKLRGNFAAALLDAGQTDEAIAVLQQVLTDCTERLGPRHPETGFTLDRLGGAMTTKGDLDVAARYYRQALEIFDGQLGPHHPETLLALGGIGHIAQLQGDLVQAQAAYRKVVRGLDGRRDVKRADVLNNLGVIALDLDDLDEAIEMYRQALDAYTVAIGRDHPHVGITLLSLGYALVERGRPDEAIEPLQEALAITEREDATGGRRRGDTRFWLARALIAADRDGARARALLEAAADDFAGLGAPGQDRLDEARAVLASLR